MSDNLAVITKVISEHRGIREHLKLAGDTVNDLEALFTLQRTQSGWSQASTTALVDRRDELLRAISFLEQGLSNHFAFEEAALVPLFGELLMKAIVHEHRGISRQIDGARTMLASIKLEGLEQRELLSQKSGVQDTINRLCQAVEVHAHNEETILNMVKKAMEENRA